MTANKTKFVIQLKAEPSVEDAHWIIEEMPFQTLEDAIAWIRVRSNTIGSQQ